MAPDRSGMFRTFGLDTGVSGAAMFPEKGCVRRMFSLQRVYAYTVRPQRCIDKSELVPPSGGAVKITQGLRGVISAAFAKVQTKILTAVDFDISATREHLVREDLMTIAFGATQAPKTAATRMATRLSVAMDNRSGDALLLITVEVEAPKHRVSMLVLPREDVVQMNGKSTEEVLLNLLRDAFSTGSALRKFARVEGHESRTQFLTAEIIDLQLTVANKEGADFWVKEFLMARLRMNSESGSRKLVAALRRAFEAASEHNRDAAFAAMLKAGSGIVKRTSLIKYAEELPAELHSAYFHGIEDEVQRTAFDVNQDVMRDNLGRRIFEAKDGVIISAPAETVGQTVRIQADAQARLVKYEGVIKKERVANRGRTGRTTPPVTSKKLKNEEDSRQRA